MEKFIADDRIHEGHRKRMRSKVLAHGKQIFDTYELLEMLLYTVVPYKDTNPISKRLLAAFDNLDGVFFANREDLIKVNGIGERAADFLKLVGKLSEIIGRVRGSSFFRLHFNERYFNAHIGYLISRLGACKTRAYNGDALTHRHCPHKEPYIRTPPC